MTEFSASNPQSPAQTVERCQAIFAHAWMVRTFVKHSDEIENFPELMQIVRAVFDTSRALEPKVGELQEYLMTLRKKLPKLRAATEQFRKDAPIASDHTNFKQAVISMDACVAELEAVLKTLPSPAPAAMPASFRASTRSSNVVEAAGSAPPE